MSNSWELIRWGSSWELTKKMVGGFWQNEGSLKPINPWCFTTQMVEFGWNHSYRGTSIFSSSRPHRPSGYPPKRAARGCNTWVVSELTPATIYSSFPRWTSEISSPKICPFLFFGSFCFNRFQRFHHADMWQKTIILQAENNLKTSAIRVRSWQFHQIKKSLFSWVTIWLWLT